MLSTIAFTCVCMIQAVSKTIIINTRATKRGRVSSQTFSVWQSKYELLGSYRGFIYIRFEVKHEMISHTFQKLYPIYPRYQRGGYRPPRFSTISYHIMNPL